VWGGRSRLAPAAASCTTARFFASSRLAVSRGALASATSRRSATVCVCDAGVPTLALRCAAALTMGGVRGLVLSIVTEGGAGAAAGGAALGMATLTVVSTLDGDDDERNVSVVLTANKSV